MKDTNAALATGAPHLDEVLLGYLLAAPDPLWPGGDGMTVDDVLREYLVAAAAGQVPDCEQLLALHPEFAREARAFFAGELVFDHCRKPTPLET